MRVGLHAGGSVLPGTESALIACAEGEMEGVARAWERLFWQRGLGAPLREWRAVSGQGYLHGRCFPLLDARRLEALLEAGRRARGPSKAVAAELDRCADACAAYASSVAVHADVALARGWPAYPLALGRVPALVFGCGVRHRIVPMNLAPATSALLTLAGADKDVCRGLLHAHGLPVAEGGRADSVEEAVRMARALGGAVVLKRVRGANGRDVRVDLRHARDVRRAARELLAGHRCIIVERCVPGTELRAHFVRGQLAQVLQRGAADDPPLARVAAPLVPLDVGHGAAAALHPADVALLERFLARHGSPSGAFDIIVPRLGARIAEGGAILEVNVPSGTWYLANREQVAAAELDGWLREDPGFMQDDGRVPLWLLPEGALTEGVARQVASAFRRTYPDGEEVRVTSAQGWLPVLTSSAAALLVAVDEAAIERHGLPMHLQPRIWRCGSLDAFVHASPLLAAAAMHCGEGVRFGTVERG